MVLTAPVKLSKNQQSFSDYQIYYYLLKYINQQLTDADKP
jgi:hypothetical protein